MSSSFTTRTAAVAVCLLLLCRSVSSSLVDHLNRMKFIRAMDEVTRQTNHFHDFQQRLLDKVRPVTTSRVLDQQNDDQYVNRLNLENYALKYAGCQNIKTWSDNMAQDEESDTVFATKRFVVFRMCPAEHCSAYNSHGCNSNYGEYMITMEDYLAIMAQYDYTRFQQYCATCKACMSYSEQQVSYQDKQHNGGRKLVRQLANDDYYAYVGDDDGGGNDDAAGGDDQVNNDDAAGDDAVDDQQADDYVGDDAAGGDDQVNNDDAAGGDDQVNNDDAAGDDQQADDYVGDDGAANDDAAAAGDDQANAVAYGDDVAANDDASAAAGDDAYNVAATDDATQEAGDDFYSFVDDDTYKDDDSAGGRGKSSYSNCGLSTCYNYQSVCADYNVNSADLSKYFACSQFNMGNKVVYIGPHCKKDGHGITLGLFDDEECSEYLGGISNVQEFTGIAFSDDSLSFYYPKTCVSCANEGAWTLQDGNNEGDAYAYDLCETLYDTSAKCHKYLSSSSSVYESENQEETDGSVCTFIQSLEQNHYDEDGEINLANLYFDRSQWTDYHQYTKFVSPAQIVGLVASISLFLGLLFYSCCLHNAIRQKGNVRKARNYQNSLLYHKQVPTGQVSPSFSGITQLRSQDESFEKTWASNEHRSNSKKKTWAKYKRASLKPKDETWPANGGSSSSMSSAEISDSSY